MTRLTILPGILALVVVGASQDQGSSGVLSGTPLDAGCELCIDISDSTPVVSFLPGSAEPDTTRPCSRDPISAIALSFERGQGAHRISIVTHAEWIAPGEVDLDRALRRAKRVQDLLIQRGVPSDVIDTQALGPRAPYSESRSSASRTRYEEADIEVQW